MFPKPTAIRHGLGFGTPAGLSRLIGAALRKTGFWFERARQRRALAQLSNAELRDIGLSRGEALGEAQKPFWR